jgi:very-short-patch-repair endonuclease
MARSEAGQFVLSAANGTVVALAGIDGESLRSIIDATEPEGIPRPALFIPLISAPTTEILVDRIIDLLAETAFRLWPVWFGGSDFSRCRNDTLGRIAARAIAGEAAARIAGLSAPWAEAAASLALRGAPPRVAGTLPAVEVAQLALAIGGSGFVLVVDMGGGTGSHSAVTVHGLEWIAAHAPCGVIALFREVPRSEPPFDRILYGARQVVAAEPGDAHRDAERATAPLWIAPWRGSPHPLSDVERRLASALSNDNELAPLFAFNRSVVTVRGSRPRVDLVWTEGRLVVELDGYGSHGNRAAFIYDRQRDYELSLSGYTVLRLANEEVEQDYGKAIDKIRDLVRLRQRQVMREE